MMIVTLLEQGLETRVAITPSSAQRFIKKGFTVSIEKNAGKAAGFTNQAYEKAGVCVLPDKEILLKKAKILLCVNEPYSDYLPHLAVNSLLIGHIENEPQNPSALIKECLQHSITLFSMNLIPRLSRAQSMDSLSSQANLAGYKAVLAGVDKFSQVIPMMMTAAGMIQPAKILVLGAGVAGLQAIATAKRLGAVVYAFDVRQAAKEQTESLGAQFIEVDQKEQGETASGYAAETPDEYKKLQAELIDNYARKADIIISTALIPGKKAPILLYKHTVDNMKAGSVIVDLATSRGGNCELSVVDKTIRYKNITIIGLSNLARLVPTTASELYANNLVHLLDLLIPNPLDNNFDSKDEIIKQALITYKNKYMPFQANGEHQNA